MRIIMAGLVLIVCCGCSGGIFNNRADSEMRQDSPMFGRGQRVPVLYPGREKVSDASMVQAFGPSWHNMEADFPAYNFNP
jgi:hypothetical protein